MSAFIGRNASRIGAMMRKVPPRIYCLIAAKAPIAAVFLRGPTNWSHLGRWDLAAGRYEAGAWLGGRIFPRRSDLSPDGRFLCYFAHKPSATWEHGEAYVALSKLPWLTALHAFRTCGTWTRGYYFTEDGANDRDLDSRLPIPFGIRSIPVVQFANERRRGWEEAPDSPPRHPADAWDERRNACVQKRQPLGGPVLFAQRREGQNGDPAKNLAVSGWSVDYWLETEGNLLPLDHLQWADWDERGHLLAATRHGQLQICRFDGDRMEILFEEDLSQIEPNPTEAPHWAQEW